MLLKNYKDRRSDNFPVILDVSVTRPFVQDQQPKSNLQRRLLTQCNRCLQIDHSRTLVKEDNP